LGAGGKCGGKRQRAGEQKPGDWSELDVRMHWQGPFHEQQIEMATSEASQGYAIGVNRCLRLVGGFLPKRWAPPGATRFLARPARRDRGFHCRRPAAHTLAKDRRRGSAPRSRDLAPSRPRGSIRRSRRRTPAAAKEVPPCPRPPPRRCATAQPPA